MTIDSFVIDGTARAVSGIAHAMTDPLFVWPLGIALGLAGVCGLMRLLQVRTARAEEGPTVIWVPAGGRQARTTWAGIQAGTIQVETLKGGAQADRETQAPEVLRPARAIPLDAEGLRQFAEAVHVMSGDIIRNGCGDAARVRRFGETCAVAARLAQRNAEGV